MFQPPSREAILCRTPPVFLKMIGSRFSGIAVRKSEIAASGPLVPASRASRYDRSGKPTGLGASEPTISDNGLLCQLQARWGMGFLPQT